MRNQVAIVVILIAMGVIALVTFNSRSEPRNPVMVNDNLLLQDTDDYLTFETYELGGELYQGVIAQVNFAGKEDAKTYQSIIEEGVKTFGVNFAGKYSVVTWGCGANCQVSTVVDVVTGEIVEYGIMSSYGLAYSPWSSLFIVNPLENIPIKVANNENISSDFYILNNSGKLVYRKRHIPEDLARKQCSGLTASAQSAFTREIRDFVSSCSIPYGWEIVEDSIQ